MNEYTPDLYELTDDEGNVRQFELLDAAELGGEQYYVMVPAVEDENYLNEELGVIFLKSVFEDDEEILVTIDDIDEYTKVTEFFLERMDDDDF